MHGWDLQLWHASWPHRRPTWSGFKALSCCCVAMPWLLYCQHWFVLFVCSRMPAIENLDESAPELDADTQKKVQMAHHLLACGVSDRCCYCYCCYCCCYCCCDSFCWKVYLAQGKLTQIFVDCERALESNILEGQMTNNIEQVKANVKKALALHCLCNANIYMWMYASPFVKLLQAMGIYYKNYETKKMPDGSTCHSGSCYWWWSCNVGVVLVALDAVAVVVVVGCCCWWCGCSCMLLVLL